MFCNLNNNLLFFLLYVSHRFEQFSFLFVFFLFVIMCVWHITNKVRIYLSISVLLWWWSTMGTVIELCRTPSSDILQYFRYWVIPQWSISFLCCVFPFLEICLVNNFWCHLQYILDISYIISNRSSKVHWNNRDVYLVFLTWLTDRLWLIGLIWMNQRADRQNAIGWSDRTWIMDW